MSSSPDAPVPPHFNYAKALEIHSVAAAIVFAVLYVPLAAWFIRQFTINTNRIYVVLTLFCSIRIAAFGIRAALAGIEAAGENLSLVTADEVLIGVGYFGLLYSAYTLVLDLDLISNNPPPQNPFLIVIRNRRLFRLTLVIAVILGIVSSSTDNGQGSTASALHKVSVAIFLVLTILQALQTAVLARKYYADGSQYKNITQQPFGRTHAIFILLLISLFLMIREIFSAATVTDSRRQNTEHFWYPLLAIPEIIAVILYSAPGLVPTRHELNHGQNVNSGEHVVLQPQQQQQQQYYPRSGHV